MGTISKRSASLIVCMAIVLPACVNALGAEIIPAPARIKTDHPRLLVRTNPTSYAVSLSELRAAPKDKDYDAVLAQLRRQDSASAQAMVWLLTGDAAAADKAIARLRAYRFPGEVDTFHIYFTLTEFGLAYDWLYNYEGFTPALKAEARANAMPLAQFGLRQTNDHMFHNYIWMSAGGVAMWAMAIAGEDEPSNRLFEQIRARFNEGLFPAWKYLDGLPSEPMGYWALYVFSPGVLTILAAQSAFEANAVGLIRDSDGNWLDRHFENLIHSTLPDMRYIPWGDLQSGPNGGVTREMAGIIDALTWATRSAHGAYFSDWIAKRRGLGRFEGDTAMFYLLYSRRLSANPQLPPLSFFAGSPQGGQMPTQRPDREGGPGGHFIARGGWGDGDTVVAFRCTDHFGDHHHYDQGSFVIYRNGLLAVDPPVYSKVRGPQQPTDVHNTLLLGGQPQRPVRGQWFKTVEEFQQNLKGGRMLETGDVLFRKDGGDWAAVAGQFAQAYPPELAQSCVRQMLFVRPGAVVIVDQLVAPAGKELPEVQWLLQTPAPPTVDGTTVWTTNGKSWLRCRALSADAYPPTVEPTAVKTHRVSYRYKASGPLVIAHVLEVGDGTTPGKAIEAAVAKRGESLECSLGGRVFVFSTQAPYEVVDKGK